MIQRPCRRSLEHILPSSDPVRMNTYAPRGFRLIFFFFFFSLFFLTAYGEYNGLVQEVARVRGQAIALWDFESVIWSDSTKMILKELQLRRFLGHHAR